MIVQLSCFVGQCTNDIPFLLEFNVHTVPYDGGYFVVRQVIYEQFVYDRANFCDINRYIFSFFYILMFSFCIKSL